MNEGTRSGKSTICLLGISAERPTNGLYLYFITNRQQISRNIRISNEKKAADLSIIFLNII
jgi:hypothetical protein